MADTENVPVGITIPTVNIEQAITQAVVNSKIGDMIQNAIASFLGSQYQLQEDIKREVKQVITGEIRQALGTEYDPETKEQVATPAAQRLRKAVIAEVERTLNEPEAIQKLVDSVMKRGY